jgi:catechol-2,3-dioxygenase
MPRIRPARFVHVVYRTRQFDKMIAWYQVVFDCKVQYQNPVLAFLTYDDEHHRVAIINLAAVQPDSGKDERRGVIGVDHVAYTYSSVEDLLENYAQLKEKGIVPYWCVHYGITMSMYYADPDGNQMELQVDAPSHPATTPTDTCWGRTSRPIRSASSTIRMTS